MTDFRQVIVIGSGPTGAIAARELVRRGIQVTMLESGSAFQGGFLVRLSGRNFFRRVPEMQHGDRHVACGDPKTDWYYNLAPGGLSNQWTGAVPRFSPEDFTEGERLHERYRWPVTYDELAPYYEVAERLLDITAGPDDVPSLPAGFAAYRNRLPEDWHRVAECAAERGQGLTTTPLADGTPRLVVRRGTAFNSFTNIVRPLMKSPNFTLITGAHALSLEWNAASRRVDSVVYHDRSDGRESRLEAGSFIVACGALNSTKLLFDSTSSDFPQGLGNSQGLLGQFLHDHPREWWVFDMEKPITLLSPSAYLTRAPHATSPPLMANSWTLGLVTLKDKVLSRFGWKGSSVGVQVFGTMIPSEEHFVKPSETKKDEFGRPLLDIRIRYDDEVICNMIQARERLLSLMEEAGNPSKIRPVEPQLSPGTSVHYAGTARMHASPKFGITDAWSRLYDCPNVLVADAATFTTGCEKNPTLTAMALAARAVDRLASDLKSR